MAVSQKCEPSTVNFVLWKYENHLRKSGQKSYKLMRFDDIKEPNREHIAPKTKKEEPEAGYDKYDEKFKHEYLLGELPLDSQIV